MDAYTERESADYLYQSMDKTRKSRLDRSVSVVSDNPVCYLHRFEFARLEV